MRRNLSKYAAIVMLVGIMGVVTACGKKGVADIQEATEIQETADVQEATEIQETADIQETTDMQEENIRETMIDETEADTEGNTEESIVELTESDMENWYQYSFPFKTKCRVDLDGDKTAEEVYVNYDFSTFETSVTINGTEYGKKLEECVSYNNSFVENYYIVDVDCSDNYKEIVLCGSGLSSDPEFHFIRFSDGTIVYLGSIYGFNYELDVRGDGTIVCGGRLNVLQTWGAPFTWELKDGKISLVEQEWYYPYVNTYYYGKTKQNKTLTLYEKPDLESATVAVEPTEETVNFGVTDNKEWVQFFRGDGVGGWIYLEDLEFDSFENLSLYD